MSNNDMLGKIVKLIVGLPVEVIGTLYDLVEKLGGKEGVVWLAGLKRFLRKENSWEQPLFKYDKTKDGWTLLEDVPFDGRKFIPEFLGFLKTGESWVGGEKMKLRAVRLNANFGQHHAEWLLENQGKIPKELQGKFLIFPGTEWMISDRSRHIPCLLCDNGEWSLFFDWIDNDWDERDLLVRSRE